MNTALKKLSTEQVEQLIERTIDRRLQVWLKQVLDALAGPDDEDKAALRPEFAEALRRSRVQVLAEEGLASKRFASKLGDEFLGNSAYP